jgi:cold shock CspA family protein
MKGTVTRVFLPRGFGFVKGDDGLDYFLQADAFMGTWDGATIKEGARLEFVPTPGGAGGNGLKATRAMPCRGS